MIKVAKDVRKLKADRLVSITSVKEGDENTLYYHFSFNKKTAIKELSVKVPKGKTVESITGVYPIAALLEAELTELFGVKFKGNSLSGKRLFQGEGKPVQIKCSVKGSFRVTKDA